MANERQKLDVIIIGGGPAGMSAAIWCSDLGLRALLVERATEYGGNLLNIYNRIENYPGAMTSNGRELRDLFLSQARKTDTEMLMQAEVTDLDPVSMSVVLANGETKQAGNIIIATGLRRRRLGIPGENEFVGRGILDSGSRSPEAVAGKRVAIVGGGDAAFENAVILSKHARRVYVIYRGHQPTARAEFTDAVDAIPNVEIRLESVVRAVEGSDTVERIVVQTGNSNQTERIAVDNVLFRVGVEPCSEIVRGLVKTDHQGFIKINELCETDRASIFAVGDVASPISPTIVSAAGQAATVAKVIRSRTR